MKPETKKLLEASGCADIGELFDRMVGLAQLVKRDEAARGAKWTATDWKYLVAATHADNRTHEHTTRSPAAFVKDFK